MSLPADPADADPNSDAEPPNDPSEFPAKRSRIISSVLSPAVRLWVRSQLEQVETLHLTIEANDRQILSGAIEQVTVSAQKAVYRGIHLSQAHITAQTIRTNLRQILRGKPLRLLAPFPVTGDVLLSEADLNASLKAPLMATAIADFLLIFLKSAEEGVEDGNALQLHDPQIQLQDGQATLTANLMSTTGNPTAVAIRTGLRLENGNKLMLDRPLWLPHAKARQGLLLKELDGYPFYLGSDVSLNELTISTGQIFCRGQVTVTPDDGNL